MHNLCMVDIAKGIGICKHPSKHVMLRLPTSELEDANGYRLTVFRGVVKLKLEALMEHQLEDFVADDLVTVCSWKENVIMVWAWVLS